MLFIRMSVQCRQTLFQVCSSLSQNIIRPLPLLVLLLIAVADNAAPGILPPIRMTRW